MDSSIRMVVLAWAFLLASCIQERTMADETALPYLIDSWIQATEGDLLRFEKHVKMTLPTSYRSFIVKRNGGYFAYSADYPPARDTPCGGGIDAFFSYNCPKELSHCDVYEEWRLHKGRIPRDTVPIANAPGGLVLINTRNGHVLFWERDREMWSPPEENQLFLASDFSTYLKGLCVPDLAERRRDSWDNKEPFISIISHDVKGWEGWLEKTRLDELTTAVKLKLFQYASGAGNIAVVRDLLQQGTIDPRSPETCRIADEAGGEIVVMLLKAGSLPGDFKKNEPDLQGTTIAYLRAWEKGHFRSGNTFSQDRKGSTGQPE